MNLVELVFAMGIVTYIPRMLPMVFMQRLALPKRAKRFMSLIPYAALGALIFPGVLTSTGSMASALAGCAAAALISLLSGNLVMVVAGGIITVFIFNVLG